MSPTTDDESITYSWKNISVMKMKESQTWKLFPKRNKDIEAYHEHSSCQYFLKDISGIAYPGQILVLMGSSGAGKSTLLNVLTFRDMPPGLQVTGQRLVNGDHAQPSVLMPKTGYTQQDDLFIGTLCVREQLIFQALLKMDPHISKKEKLRRVDKVLLELGLKKCANTLIGVPGRVKGISGGEKKRLSLACEVLTDPPLLFCDEPTSGLDSFLAQSIVQTLRSMAKKGKTIIATIHQPSSEVYALFDRLMLLAEGRMVFQGSQQEALDFFKSQSLACPNNYNPADFFIHSIAVKPDEDPELGNKRISDLATAFTLSQAGQQLLQIVTEECDGILPRLNSGLRTCSYCDPTDTYRASWLRQFSALSWRSWVGMLKDPLMFRTHIVQTVLVALILGLTYWKQELTQEGVMNINGALFLFMAYVSMQNMFCVINVFCMELPIFLREHSNRMYRTDAYFLSKTLTEMPIFVCLPMLFICIVYYMTGLNPQVERFFTSMFIVTLSSNVATSFGYIVSCMSSDITIALSMATPMSFPILLCGGFFLNKDSIPSYLSWFSYLSWYLYSNELLSVNQWDGIEDIRCSRFASNNLSCISSGNLILLSLGFSRDNFYSGIGYLIGQLLFFRIIAFILLLIRSFTRK